MQCAEEHPGPAVAVSHGATFADRDSFTACRDHPGHQRILDEMILPNLSVRTVVQSAD